MPVQHAPTPPAASSSYDRHDPSEYPHSAASSEYSVIDWFSGLVATQGLRLSDDSDPKSSSFSHSTKSTTDSHERRQNPKLIKSSAGSRAVSLSLETLCDNLVIDYKYRIHTKELGHLYGLCDAVPYLLGPRSYLQAIEAFGNYPIPMEAYQDHQGNFVLDPDKITASDKVFMTMLWLLNTSVDQRPADWEEFYTGMSLHSDRLIVYKDVGFGREPEVEAMHYDEFISMAIAWNQLPNPALVAEDRPDVITPWAIVVDKIRKKNIPLEDIDKALYTELVGMTEDEAEARLTTLSTTNELAMRKTEIAETGLKRNATNTFTYVMPQETNPNVMYAKRFSHQFPKGYLLDTTTPGHDDLLFPAAKMRQDAEELRKEREAVKEKKRVSKARQKAKYRCKTGCLWVLAFAVLLGVAVGIVVIYHYNKVDNSARAPPT